MNLTEKIRRILIEETQGIDSFIETLLSKHNLSDELISKIKEFIENSNCKNIEFSDFNIPAMGIALHDRVMINHFVLNQQLEMVLFIIFHEIAHQYQFKKYGEDIMYDCYIGEISDEEAADFMKKTEIVADEFAARKIRQLQKEGLIEKRFIPPQMYKNVPMQMIRAMVNKYRNEIKQKNIKTPEKISEYFYNMVKGQL